MTTAMATGILPPLTLVFSYVPIGQHSWPIVVVEEGVHSKLQSWLRNDLDCPPMKGDLPEKKKKEKKKKHSSLQLSIKSDMKEDSFSQANKKINKCLKWISFSF
jgi:hypothetical protein